MSRRARSPATRSARRSRRGRRRAGPPGWRWSPTCRTRPTTISWSPPGRRCSTVHSRTASTSSSRGLPVGPCRCRTPSQAAVSPRRAKLADRCSLRCREHIHHERAVPADGPQRQAAEVEADQDERGVERQRGDRVGGGAHRRAVSADRRDHRDAGREMAHGVTELCGRHGGPPVSLRQGHAFTVLFRAQ